MSEILMQSGDALLKTALPVDPEPSSSFDFLQILRFLFYLLVAVKLIELSFLRRKKHSLKERVYRKFLFAHQELLKQFTEEDRVNMEHTLSNTIKNANIDFRGARNKPKSKKHVNFTTEKNSYYDPKQWKSDIEDEETYLDIDDKAEAFQQANEGDVRGKMIEEEFAERENLGKINEKEEEIEIEASKLTQDTQIPSEIPSEIPSQGGISEVVQVSDLPVDSLLLQKSSQGSQGEGEEASREALKKQQ